MAYKNKSKTWKLGVHMGWKSLHWASGKKFVIILDSTRKSFLFKVSKHGELSSSDFKQLGEEERWRIAVDPGLLGKGVKAKPEETMIPNGGTLNYIMKSGDDIGIQEDDKGKRKRVGKPADDEWL
jgi:hypothetical protein